MKRVPQPIYLADMHFEPSRQDVILLATASERPPHDLVYSMEVNLKTFECRCTCRGQNDVMEPRARAWGMKPNLLADNLICRHLRKARGWLVERRYLTSNILQQVFEAAPSVPESQPVPAYPDDDDDLHDAPPIQRRTSIEYRSDAVVLRHHGPPLRESEKWERPLNIRPDFQARLDDPNRPKVNYLAVFDD